MRPETVPGLIGLRVLIVEDEMLVAYDIAMTLEDLGCEVSGPVPTLDEALAAVGSESLDGVLLDANLDGTSSAPIADALVSRSIPFVVITGYGGLRLPTETLDAAPRVTKPYNLGELAETLRAVFSGSDSADRQ